MLISRDRIDSDAEEIEGKEKQITRNARERI